jgi:hypothetical protein
MTLHYRETDPISGRWTANTSGVKLSSFQGDENIYTLDARITATQAMITASRGIVSITSSLGELTFNMSDSTTEGPIAMPVAAFLDRGAWAPLTAYAVNDTFDINGTLYRVLFAHTSAATFSAGANDGLGHNYYSAMLSLPGNSLPTGGATGQMLKKSSGADFDVTWGYPVPTGGAATQVLTKTGTADFAMAWRDNAASGRFPSATALSVNTAGTADLDPTLGDVFTLTPVGDVTIDALSAPVDAKIVVIITTSGTSPHTISFGTDFDSAGTIATGTVSGVIFTISFCGNGTALVETARSPLGSIASFPEATTAQYLANTAGKALSTDKVWAAADLVALTDAATIAADLSTIINGSVTLGGNRTLGNPSNTKNGQTGFIKFTQDGTGSRTLAYGSNWKFAGGTAPILTTAAGAVDLLFYQVISATFIYATLIRDVK